jgi:hypothetical protein
MADKQDKQPAPYLDDAGHVVGDKQAKQPAAPSELTPTRAFESLEQAIADGHARRGEENVAHAVPETPRKENAAKA